MKPNFRALHLDLKGVPPAMPRLLRLMEIARESGYNALLVEWEDQFPWREIRYRNETCYTDDEIRAFHEHAASLELEVIPLVQCLGHMETWLRIPENKELRELPQHVDVLNPLAKGARSLVEGLVDEVLDRTPDCRHFHLGGDEAWTFGHHPDTKAYIEQHGKGALYLHHVEPILDRLASRGVRPILWHDMMLEWDDAALKAIAVKADLCVWAYNRFDRKRTPWARALTEAENSSRPPILEGGGGVPACDTLFERFRKAGITMWGAGAYKAGLSDIMYLDVPDPVTRLTNIADWAVIAGRYPFAGLVNTAWSRATTDTPQYQPIDAALDLMVACGRIWSGKAAASGDPGNPDAPWRQHVLDTALSLIEHSGEKERFVRCRDLMERLTRQRRAGWMNAIKSRETIACMEADVRRRALLNADKMLGYLKNNLAALEHLRAEILDVFRDLVPSIWMERYCDERMQPLRQEYDELANRLQKTATETSPAPQ
ncbi:MAG: family 20 glycosylhydrolase [Spirochaetes bacterium]|nr:family 20 glycosylhydrolase [Spirochaetota bacterium]